MPRNFPQSDTRPEWADVLFTYIVAYSTLPMEGQRDRIVHLMQIVRETALFKRASKENQIVCLPTGDGMALVFFRSTTAAIDCAIEISRALRNKSELKVRMGVHTGVVIRLEDINSFL